MSDLSKFIDIFLSEAEENIQKLNINLLSLEKVISKGKDELIEKKLLNELMRASHTIKGSSASMGFVNTAYATHVMEDVFDNARKDALKIDKRVINTVFGLIDNLDKSIKLIKDTGKEIDFTTEVEKLKKITGVNTVGIGKSVREVEPSIKLANSGEKVKTEVVDSLIEKKSTPDILLSKPENDKENLANQLRDIEAITKIDYIKVPIERLDTLLDLVEELLIDKMKFEQLCVKYPDLKEVYAHMDLLISGIQYQVMQSHLVPVEQVFNRFPRLVRDLSQRLEKQIEFTIVGGDIELDRTIVDKLGEPLIHLLRNAVDHGIDKKGTIKLEAYRKNNYVLISVENDCNNLDKEKIKLAAIKRGIITAQNADKLSEEDIIELIFDPQLSTKEQVTEISGRGVGLSVVKNFANMLSGRVLVENINPGVRFTLELPLTLAIINSLLVEVSNSIFAIPFSNIERSIVLNCGDIKKMADNEVAVVDGIKVPLARLEDIFHLKKYHRVKVELESMKKIGSNKKQEVSISDSENESENIIVVLVKKENELIGIVVDNLISKEEIIVKPLSPVLRQVRGFSGATILGDGQTALILDVMNILN